MHLILTDSQDVQINYLASKNQKSLFINITAIEVLFTAFCLSSPVIQYLIPPVRRYINFLLFAEILPLSRGSPFVLVKRTECFLII